MPEENTCETFGNVTFKKLFLKKKKKGLLMFVALNFRPVEQTLKLFLFSSIQL